MGGANGRGLSQGLVRTPGVVTPLVSARDAECADVDELRALTT